MSASLAALRTNSLVLLMVLFSKNVGAGPTVCDPQCGTWLNVTENHHSTVILTYQITKSTFITTAASCESIPPSSDPPCDTPCGPVCCGSGQYCFTMGECRSASAVPPIRPTSDPSIPFETPVPTFPSSSTTGFFDPDPSSTFGTFTSTTAGGGIVLADTTSESRASYG